MSASFWSRKRKPRPIKRRKFPVAKPATQATGRSVKVIRRHGGGFVAVSGDGMALRIGVTAETEDEARTEFWKTVARWDQILQQKDKPHDPRS